MFLKERLQNVKDREYVEGISEDFAKLVEKEGNIVKLLTNAEYTETYMSMLLLKVNYLIKDGQQLIDKISNTFMIDDVKRIHLVTAQQMIERLCNIKKTIQQAHNDLQLVSVMERECKRQELIQKLLKECQNEKD